VPQRPLIINFPLLSADRNKINDQKPTVVKKHTSPANCPSIYYIFSSRVKNCHLRESSRTICRRCPIFLAEKVQLPLEFWHILEEECARSVPFYDYRGSQVDLCQRGPPRHLHFKRTTFRNKFLVVVEREIRPFWLHSAALFIAAGHHERTTTTLYVLCNFATPKIHAKLTPARRHRRQQLGHNLIFQSRLTLANLILSPDKG
jgi:hypothetical protein